MDNTVFLVADARAATTLAADLGASNALRDRLGHNAVIVTDLSKLGRVPLKASTQLFVEWSAVERLLARPEAAERISELRRVVEVFDLLPLPPPKPIRDFEPQSLVFSRESMADGFGCREVRETYYRVLEYGGGKFVLRERLGVAQGDLGGSPRYRVLLKSPCVDPPSSHGLLPVYPITHSAFWRFLKG